MLELSTGYSPNYLVYGKDGTIHFQWYRSHKDYQTMSPILPVWWDGSEGYRAEKPRDDSHEPYTGSMINNEDWSMEIAQADLARIALIPASAHQNEPNRRLRMLRRCIWWPDKANA